MKNTNINKLKGQNADVAPMMAAKEGRPEDGYDIPVQVSEWMSDNSIEVMRHFGIEAPDLLNKYCNALEDALIEQVRRVKHLEARLAEMKEAA